MTVKRSPPDWSFKILLIGDSSVGKTSLMFRFAENTFDESLKPTIGIDFKIKNVIVRDKAVKLQLWDTAGQEKFFNIARSYYRNADAIILVYDRTEATSFRSITRWMRNIDENAPEDVVRILVGNKSDAQNRLVISSEEGQALGDQFRVSFFETSAKSENNPNVSKMFHALAEKLLDHKKPAAASSQDSNRINLSDPTPKSHYDTVVTCCSTGRASEK